MGQAGKANLPRKKKWELLLLAYTETWFASATGRLDDWM